MKNPQPRFAYDEENDWIFDYVTSQSHPCDVILHAPDGSWDLVKVKELILAGKSIESAYLGAEGKVEQAGADFLAEDGWKEIPPEGLTGNIEPTVVQTDGMVVIGEGVSTRAVEGGE